jgi:hypothetical protein
MTKPNFLVEISNDARTIRNPNGLSPQEVADFLANAGQPTRLEGSFGERSNRPDGFDAAAIVKFLSRDSSWFSTEASSDD